MSNILNNVKIYFSFLGASLKEMLIYRLDCLVGIVSQVVTQAVEIIFVFIAFRNTENLAGWNFKQVLLLYGITLISVGIKTLCVDGLYDFGPKYGVYMKRKLKKLLKTKERVNEVLKLRKNGEFDKILLRPVHPLISILGATKEFVALGYLVLGFAMTIIMLIKLSIPITFILIVRILFFSIIGAAIIGAINTICSISSFWTYRSNEVIWSFDRIYTFAQYPIDIYSSFIKILITYILPFAFVAYYPSLAYLGMDKYMIYLSPVVAMVLWIVAVKIWNLALNKYRSTGN